MAATRWALEDGSVGGFGGKRSTSGTGDEFVERVGGGSEHILTRPAVEGGVVVVVAAEEGATIVVLISSSTDGSLDCVSGSSDSSVAVVVERVRRAERATGTLSGSEEGSS